MGKEIKGKSPILLGAKAVVEPFVEEAKKAIVPEELRALSEGIRKVGKDQKKFKKFRVIKSPHSDQSTKKKKQ